MTKHLNLHTEEGSLPGKHEDEQRVYRLLMARMSWSVNVSSRVTKLTDKVGICQ
jgi:hypothetical protein